MDKAIVLMDGGYFDALNRYLLDLRKKKLSFEKLSKKVCERVSVDHYLTRFYHAYPYQDEVPTEEQKRKYQNAQKFFYTIDHTKDHEFVKVGRVRPVHFKCPNCNSISISPKQKGADVGMALDFVDMVRRHVADVFILVTGDEDYTRAVEMARRELAKVFVYYVYDPGYGIYGSVKLNEAANQAIAMDLDFLEECAMEAGEIPPP